MLRLSFKSFHLDRSVFPFQDFLDECYEIPKVTLVNNVVHNNEGYGVVLVKLADSSLEKEGTLESLEGRNG